jgi:hypothetical protein
MEKAAGVNPHLRWYVGITAVVVGVLWSFAVGLFLLTLPMLMGALLGRYRTSIGLIWLGAILTNIFLPYALSAVIHPPPEAALVIAGAWVTSFMLLVCDFLLIFDMVKRVRRAF